MGIFQLYNYVYQEVSTLTLQYSIGNSLITTAEQVIQAHN